MYISLCFLCYNCTPAKQVPYIHTYSYVYVCACMEHCDYSQLLLCIYFCTARKCQPLSKMKGITAIKSHGETFQLHCSSPSHINERTAAGDIYNFTKFNESTGELESIYQGKIFSKMITNYDDAGTYILLYTAICKQYQIMLLSCYR